MFNLTLPRPAWPKFVNISHLLLHLDKRYGATCSLEVEADPPPPILGKYMMYCSFSYSHICIKSLLHYLIYFYLYIFVLCFHLYIDMLYQLLPYFHLALLFQYI